MRFKDALCEGSDAWFPTNNQDRAVVVGLCRNECPAYRECLEWALSGVELLGVVAGLTETGRTVQRRKQRKGSPVYTAKCGECEQWFDVVLPDRGRPPVICSMQCRRDRRASQQRVYRRQLRGTISA